MARIPRGTGQDKKVASLKPKDDVRYDRDALPMMSNRLWRKDLEEIKLDLERLISTSRDQVQEADDTTSHIVHFGNKL